MKLIDVFPNWISDGGIFTALSQFNVPWKDDINGQTLDLEYYGNTSGEKTISSIIGKMLEKDGTSSLIPSRVTQLATLCYNINIKNWNKEYNTLLLSYDPIENYSMVENESGTNSVDGSATNKGTNTDSHTGTQIIDETNNSSGNGSGSANNNIYGFNSTAATPANNQSTSTTNSVSGSGKITRTDNLTDTTETDTTTTTNETGNHSRRLTRSGNIGVTTSQQMIESERELWLWNYFRDFVFKTIDKTLSIATYSNVSVYSEITARSDSGGGGGGDYTEILNKLDDVNNNVTNVGLKVDQLRVSTFNAIDGVSTRAY